MHSKDLIMKITFFTGALAVVALLGACSTSQPNSELIRSVYLTQPVPLRSELVRNYTGRITEAHEISLGFKTAGQIARIHAHEGNFVHQGDLLAELDDTDYRLAVDALQIQYNQLQDEVKRTAQLLNQKSISINDYEKASAGLKQLGIQLQANQNKLNYTKLYAPTDGYIQSVNFSPAEMVDAGTALFTLMDVSHMEVTADIPSTLYQQRSRFVRFSGNVAGVAETFPLNLLSLTPKADGNQLYRLRLAFAKQPNRSLTAGMNIDVHIAIEDSTSTPGFTVPLCSLFREQDSSYVWVFEADSTVSKRAVTVGNLDPDGQAILLDGLTGQEQIVRAGVTVLKEGEKVRVIETPRSTNVGGLL